MPPVRGLDCLCQAVQASLGGEHNGCTGHGTSATVGHLLPRVAVGLFEAHLGNRGQPEAGVVRAIHRRIWFSSEQGAEGGGLQ